MEVPPPQNVLSRQNHVLQIVQGQTIVGSWADNCVVWAEGKGDDSDPGEEHTSRLRWKFTYTPFQEKQHYPHWATDIKTKEALVGERTFFFPKCPGTQSESLGQLTPMRVAKIFSTE